MPEMLDAFEGDAFEFTTLTASVNNEPFVPGQVGALGIFEEEGVTTTDLAIEERAGALELVGESARGGPGETIEKDVEKVRKLPIPHFQREEGIAAEEVQGRRAFGTADARETLEGRIVQRSMRHFRDFDATLEYQRIGALKGVILNKAGGVRTNLFTEFGVTQESTVYLDLSNATPASGFLRDACDTVIETIEDNLTGTPYSHVHCLAGRTAYKKVFKHKEVVDSYKNTVEAAFLRQGLPRTFTFGDITFERYRTGGTVNFIGDDDLHFFPMGASGLFITRFAPADYNDTVNTVGLPRYLRVFATNNNKGYKLEVQTNPISLCLKPKVLIKGSAGADPG
ncbi:MAG: major capsid protein [Pseudomonadota bacterium]